MCINKGLAFDEILQDKQPANDYHNTAAHQQMMAAIHPQYRDAYQAKPAKAAKQKPKFFENTIYIGGRSVSAEIDGQKQVYYRLVYGVQVKPSKDEEEVMVEDVEVVIEVWSNSIIKRIIFLALPVKEVNSNETIFDNTINKDVSRLSYFFDDDLNALIPILESSFLNNTIV